MSENQTSAEWTIKASDIEWSYTSTHKQGVKLPEPVEEIVFQEELALAALLAKEVVFLNTYWWQDEWPEAARKTTALLVNCNDIFAWGCADAEEMTYHDIEDVYKAWRADPVWGPAKWCMRKRNQKPQGPVADTMKKAGAWDDAMEALGSNTEDARVKALIADTFAPAKADFRGVRKEK